MNPPPGEGSTVPVMVLLVMVGGARGIMIPPPVKGALFDVIVLFEMVGWE